MLIIYLRTGNQNKNVQVIDNMRFFCFGFLFLISVSGVVLAQEAQSRSERYNFYTEEIRSVAPNIPAQPDMDISKAQEYISLMELWASQYPDEYKAVWRLNRRVSLFEPIIESDNDSNNEMVSLSEIPPFMLYPVGKEKPVFIQVFHEDKDTVFYENRLRNWYYLYDRKGYVSNYGEIPDLSIYPKAKQHPDELGLPVEFNAYFPEFYKSKEE